MGDKRGCKKINNETKRRKLAEVRSHHRVDNSLERMQFNQVLGSTRGYYVGPVCLLRSIAGRRYIHNRHQEKRIRMGITSD